MGHSHAISGALGWLALAPAVAEALGQPLAPGEIAVGALACAGAALLPDMDHPQSTVAHFLGPVSVAASRVVAAVAGGHRAATHSFLFCLLAGASATAAVKSFGQIAGVVILFLLTGLALRGLGIAPPKRDPIVAGIAIACESALVVLAAQKWLPGGGDGNWWWLPPALALGCLIHLAGDCATPEGCPLGWPHGRRYSLPVISHTGNALETKILAPLMLLGVAYYSWIRFLEPAASGVLASIGWFSPS